MEQRNAGLRLLHRLGRCGVIMPVANTKDRQWETWCPACDGAHLVRHLRVQLADDEEPPFVWCMNGCTTSCVVDALPEYEPPARLNRRPTITASSMTMADFALRYVQEFGWPVFPLTPGTKIPLARSHGMIDATTDVHQVQEWWTDHPTANIGIPTGVGTFDVLDIDVTTSGTGFGARDRLAAAGLLVGAFALVTTPRGGQHLYYAGSGQRSGSLHDLHLDFKAAGGYVLAPPSHVTDQAYEFKYPSGSYVWADGLPTPSMGGVQLDWARCRDLLRPPKRYATASSSGDASTVVRWYANTVVEGNRNNALYWAAHKVIEAGGDGLDELIDTAVRHGLDRHAAQATVRSAQRAAGGDAA